MTWALKSDKLPTQMGIGITQRLNFLLIVTHTALAQLVIGFWSSSMIHSAEVVHSPEFLSQVDRVSQTRQWLNLLHFKKPFLSWQKPRSQLAGPDFFLALDGAQNPKAELLATVEAFFLDPTENPEAPGLKVGKLKQHAQCAFPERLRYLKQELKIDPKAVPCPEYEKIMKGFQAKATALVFSSAFLGSPGSMFGHTFLKIISNRKTDLLDWGISFAATAPPEENSVLFMILGLLGGYPGDYSLLPYYTKVQEYINAESRDLWEYTLSLTREETQRLISHIWELTTNSWFDYYFINYNCAYQLLTALEVAKPEWDLSSGWFFVTPSETIKRVANIPGAIQTTRYRPSLRKKMLQKYDLLNNHEKDLFFRLQNGTLPPEQIEDPHLLETTALYFQYVKQRDEAPPPTNARFIKKS